MWVSWSFLSLCQSCNEETRKLEPFFSLHLSSPSSFFLLFSFVFSPHLCGFSCGIMKKTVKEKMGIASMDPSLYPSSCIEDSRIRFRNESLIQDYEDLEKETGGMRKKLDAIKQKRLILVAEVRFLKKRCKFLTLNQKSGQTQNSMIERNPYSKKKKQTSKESGLGDAVPRLHLNKKIRVYREAIPYNRQEEEEEEAIRIPMPVPDISRKEKIVDGNGGNSFSSRLRIFDLNQISTEEEEELQGNSEKIRTEDDQKMDYYRPRNEELKNNEANLSICRNIKKGMNRAGKRKVSWQDPVAVRV